MKIHAFRLKPGEDLKNAMQNYVDTNRIRAGVLLSCVGSLRRVMLRYANQSDGSNLEGEHEIVAATGTFSQGAMHIHLIVSDNRGKSSGGHLLQGCEVFTTAEIVIGEMPDLVFYRKQDPLTGFNELDIEST